MLPEGLLLPSFPTNSAASRCEAPKDLSPLTKPFTLPPAPDSQDEFLLSMNMDVDLDLFLKGGIEPAAFGEEGEEKEKRSLRAKKRRAKMNLLYEALGREVGLPEMSDRALILQNTHQLIQDLKRQKEMSSVKKGLDQASSMPVNPVLSMADVAREHFKGGEGKAPVPSYSHAYGGAFLMKQGCEDQTTVV